MILFVCVFSSFSDHTTRCVNSQQILTIRRLFNRIRRCPNYPITQSTGDENCRMNTTEQAVKPSDVTHKFIHVNKHEHRKRTCTPGNCVKNRYASEEAAVDTLIQLNFTRKTAKRRGKNGKKECGTYYSQWCGCWHLTSKESSAIPFDELLDMKHKHRAQGKIRAMKLSKQEKIREEKAQRQSNLSLIDEILKNGKTSIN